MVGSATPTEGNGWGRYIRGGADTVMRVLGTIVELGLVAFLIPFYFFFFSVWYPQMVEFGRGLIPRKSEERALALLSEIQQAADPESPFLFCKG